MSQSFRALLKFGGEVVADAPRLQTVLSEVRRLVESGWSFALCHGGGPQANRLQARLGMESVKVGGRRVTDALTLQVMKQVLGGEVNVDVCAAATAAGLRPVGISGASAGLVQARRRPPMVVPGGGEEPVDFGLVGKVEKIDPAIIELLWSGGFTPVINTLGCELDGEDELGRAPIYNINADTVASAVAAALRADHLFLMTSVPGVLKDKDDPSTRIPRLTVSEARGAIADGVIVGGMIPKVEEALLLLESGIGAVHILAAEPGAIEAEAAEPGSRGTVLLPG